MSNFSKVLATIGAVFGFLFIFGIIVASQKSNGGSSSGVFGFILFGGLIGGIRAIWKKPPTDVKNDECKMSYKFLFTNIQ